MTRVLNVNVRTRDLVEQADRLEAAVARAEIALAAIDAVNAVTLRADESLRAGAIDDINLSSAYVRSKTDLALATRDPRAEITVRGDLTILGRYPLVQLTSEAAKAKGDASRGIEAGRKQAGLNVSIRRSGATTQPKWFTMKLRRGRAAGENVGVFVRTGSDRGAVAHIYGPSPYSLFRHQAGLQLEDIADDLQRTADLLVGERLDRSL